MSQVEAGWPIQSAEARPRFSGIRPVFLTCERVRADLVLSVARKRPVRAMPEIVNSITDRDRLN